MKGIDRKVKFKGKKDHRVRRIKVMHVEGEMSIRKDGLGLNVKRY